MAEALNRWPKAGKRSEYMRQHSEEASYQLHWPYQ